MQEYYTPDEISKMLKIDVRTLYRWIREGKIYAIKIGHFWRVPESEIRRLLKGDKE